MARSKLKELLINQDWCKGCGICVKLCPKQVLKLNGKEKAEVEQAEACICCMLCELRCPDLAITVVKEGGNENE